MVSLQLILQADPRNMSMLLTNVPFEEWSVMVGAALRSKGIFIVRW